MKNHKTRHKTLKLKLIQIFIVLFLFAFIMLVTFFWFDKRYKQVIKSTAILKEISNNINNSAHIESSFFTYRMAQPEFYKNGDELIISELEKIADSIPKELDKLHQLKEIQTAETNVLIDSLQFLVNTNYELFDSLITLTKQRGSDNYGLIGELGNTFGQLLDLNDKFDYNSLIVIKQLELEYRLGESPEIIDSIIKITDKLKQEIKQNNSDADAKELISVINQYNILLEQICTIDKMISQNNPNGYMAKIKKHHNCIEQSLIRLNDNTLLIVNKLSYKVRIIFLLVIILWILLTVFLIIFVNRKIGMPLSDLSDSIHNSIKSNFSKNIIIPRFKINNEIGVLSKDICLLIANVQDYTEEILSQRDKIQIQATELTKQKQEMELANEKFKMIFEQSSEAHLLYDFEIIDCNNATLKLLNIEIKEELLYKKIEDLSIEFQSDKISSKQKFNDILKKSLTRGTQHIEWTLNKQGTDLPIEMTIRKVCFQNKNIALIICHDLTEQKKSEKRLKAAHKEVMLANQEIIDSNIQLEKQNIEIEIKNKQITSSISYASRIQNAILPPDELINTILPSYFILYKPRDIVSGDFYWIRQLKNYVVIVVADCTGHGVPGAFMSILGTSFLNEIGNNPKELLRPDIALNELRQRVKSSLHQTGVKIDNQDGMDISYAVIDIKKQRLLYSGANRPMVLIRNNELSYFKGDVMPIGVYPKEDAFTCIEMQIEQNDMLYLYSDGYSDQLGGPKGRKFMKRDFKILLEKIHNQPVEKQKIILNNTVEKWIEDNPQETMRKQLDDILVLGVRIQFDKMAFVHENENDWKNISILIAEDIDIQFDIIEILLMPTSANITRAKNGQQAINICNPQHPDYQKVDIILMDIEMPIVNGLDAAAMISSLNKSIPIIAQTAYFSCDKEHAFQSGCIDYITKPINPAILLKTLEKYLPPKIHL